MRKSLRVVLALSGASLLGAAFVIACSSDTSVDPGTEAGTDAANDSQPPKDGGADSAQPDAASDSAPPFDGGTVAFDELLATEQCKTLARCCYGTPTPADGGADGGTFDLAACVAAFRNSGFELSNAGGALTDAGTVVFDQVKATDCINKVKNLTCNLPGAEYTAARAACFGVFSGKFTAGHACAASVECQPGLYCSGMFDGGAGTCATIKPVGGACGANPDTQLTEYEDSCSYRGSGGTGAYCKIYDFVGGVDIAPANWKCAAAEDAGAGCFTGNWCKDSICDINSGVCTTPDKLYDTACGLYVK
jgi:hypothetical protein